MKICVAQTNPVRGNLAANIASHEALIRVAISHDARVIVFPELSITGYEPSLAKSLATGKDDPRFDYFQEAADAYHLVIGIGVPLIVQNGISISMILFQPGKSREVYSKKYLHADEEEFFTSGENLPVLTINGNNIAFAICYELSVPAHAENAFKAGAGIYIASVAKTAGGVAKACETLSGIAGKYSMPVLMSNCVGYCDNFEYGGRTSAWNNNGVLAGQLNNTDEGVIIFDTDSREVRQISI